MDHGCMCEGFGFRAAINNNTPYVQLFQALVIFLAFVYCTDNHHALKSFNGNELLSFIWGITEKETHSKTVTY